jgi:hypothetical protein
MPPRHRRTARHLLVLAGTLVLLGVAFVLVRHQSPADRFRDRAGSICRASKHDIDVAFGAQLGRDPSPTQIATFIEEVLVPELRDRIAALRSLEGGDGLDRRLAPVLDDYDEVIDGVAGDPSAAVSGDDPFAAVDRRLDDLGLEDCGSAPPS